jgi:hypothetical protein
VCVCVCVSIAVSCMYSPYTYIHHTHTRVLQVVTKLTPRSAFIHMDDEVVLSFVTMHTFVRVMWRIVKLLDSSAEDKKDYWDERAVRCWEDATEVDDEAPGCKRLPTINYVVQLFDKLVHIDGERRLDDEELCHYLKTAYSALIHVEDVKKVKRNVRDRVKMRDLDRRMSKRLTGMGLEVAEETEEEKKSTEKEFEQSMPDQFWLFPDDIVFGGYKTDLFDRRHPKPPTPPPASQPPLGAAVGFMQRLNMLDDGWQNANDVLYSERGDHLGVLPFDGVSQEGATGRGHSSSVGGSRRKRKGTLLRNGSSGRRPSSAQSSVRGRRVEGEDGVAAANTTSTEEADSQRGKVLNRSRSASCVGKFSRKPSLIQVSVPCMHVCLFFVHMCVRCCCMHIQANRCAYIILYVFCLSTNHTHTAHRQPYKGTARRARRGGTCERQGSQTTDKCWCVN